MKSFVQKTSLALLLALGATQAHAVLFDGTTAAQFVNPTGPAGMVVTGVGTSAFTWGTGYGTAASSLTFGGTSFSAATDTYFNLGTLSYYNGTILADSGAEAVDLNLSVNFTSPIGSNETFNYTLQLLNSPNVGTPEEQADKVYLPSLFSSTLFNYDGVNYTLQLGFGTVSSGGFSQIDTLYAYEGQTAQGTLVGKITSNIPSANVPDAAATAGLLALGLGALMASRRAKRAE